MLLNFKRYWFKRVLSRENDIVVMPGSRKFCLRGSKFVNVFFVLFFADEGKEDPNIAMNEWDGPSSARQ